MQRADDFQDGIVQSGLPFESDVSRLRFSCIDHFCAWRKPHEDGIIGDSLTAVVLSRMKSRSVLHEVHT